MPSSSEAVSSVTAGAVTVTPNSSSAALAFGASAVSEKFSNMV